MDGKIDTCVFNILKVWSYYFGYYCYRLYFNVLLIILVVKKMDGKMDFSLNVIFFKIN